MSWKGKKITAALVLASLFCTGQDLIAQEHLINKTDQKLLILADEQFRQGHYRLALQTARDYLHHKDGNSLFETEDDREQARFIQILSKLKLNSPGAEDTAVQFIEHTANPALKQRASFALAQYFFRTDQLAAAIPYYENASISNLGNEEIADSRFELAYAYFNSRQFDKAAPLFASIKEVQGKYYAAGNYYFGLLAYNEGRYQEALTSFNRIANEPEYKNIVPYYVAEIYYFMGDRPRALEEATALIRRPEKLYYDLELHLLAAQVLFEERRYGEALPFFEHYYQNTAQIRKEELYEMAYSYYRVNEWKNAIEKFKLLSSSQDSLGQTAMYLLGDCYLKIGDKKSARNAFGLCSELPFNQEQQEASLLLYGKISYDIGFHDAAIQSFKTLLAVFPSSEHADEAKTLLADLYLRTRDYRSAWNLIRDVSQNTSGYWSVRQKTTYSYAIEQMRSGNLPFADSLLSISLSRPVDNNYKAAAQYWKADIALRQDKPEQALPLLKDFVANAGSQVLRIAPQATMANAYLNLGYAAMETGAYADAQSWFSTARQAAPETTPIAANATVREADAAFMQKKYREALVLYDRIIAANTSESDHARLQKSILLGVQGKTSEKIALLRQLVQNTSSPVVHQARFELANTYVEEEKYQDAITTLKPLAESPDARLFTVPALLRIGFAYQGLGNSNRAIETYRKVVTDYPGAEERSIALEALKNLYIEVNQPQAYVKLLQEQDLPAPGTEALDSTYYAAAEAQIAAGRWDKARTALNDYIDRNPNGAFSTRAHYYLGEALYQLKDQQAALSAYDKVLALPWNEFSETAARRAAEMAFKASDFSRAIAYYQSLRVHAMSGENLQLAYSGLMRSSFRLSQFEAAAAYADTIMSLPEVDPGIRQEVQLMKAKALYEQGKNAEALSEFESLKTSRNELVAAESGYLIAEILLKQNRLKEAEKAAADNIRIAAGNEYWAVKSYLLIADILVRQKDLFNARATLQSLVRNTKDPSLKKEAASRLEEVKKLEQQQTKLRD